MNELTNIIAQVKNPGTGKTLGEENRIASVEEKNNQLHVTYNRDGISPEQKRTIEDEIIKALEGKFDDDKIFIFTKSTESKEVYNAIGSEAPKKSSKPAELKVGHGQVGEKKGIEGVKNIIAIGSGKGGVGKSTVTSNIASSLAQAGFSVGIVDADIYGPSIPMLFNRRGERPEATMDKKIIPLENYGVKFISFGNFIHEDEPVVWRGPMLGGVLNQFFFDTDWGELDYLLIDLPPGTGDVQLSMVQNLNVDGAIIVSTPQDVALLDARKALHMFDKLKVHVIGMVENMSSFICDSCNKEHFIYGTGGVKVACGEIGVGFLGSIPLEMAMRKGADFGRPYMSQDKFEGHKGWKAYKDIADRINGYFNPDESKKKGILSKIFNKE
jgi:ATP-binding protein involved in chromosome partitioning